MPPAGVEAAGHDLRFEEDNWAAPTLGAWGVGWQVVLDGLEISQFTYFQQAGGLDLAPISVEITYGLERLAMYLQDRDDVYDLEWAPGVDYRTVRLADEQQSSRYAFEEAPVAELHGGFDQAIAEGRRLVGVGLVIPGYEQCLRASHLFNLLDARGAVSVSDRPSRILAVRALAMAAASRHLEGGEA